LRERRREGDNKLRDGKSIFLSLRRMLHRVDGTVFGLKAPAIYFEAVYMQLKIAVMTRHGKTDM
jgi:hypothetical protein